MRHLDLFSGIGGFSLAVDNIFHEQKNEHTFVEYDPFCQEVLKKHWPEAEIHGDIRQFVADAKRERTRIEKQGASTQGRKLRNESESEMVRQRNWPTNAERFGTGDTFLLTGGFPCQPFSQAGRRKGTADDRYLWPPMLECISLFKPRWVIAENVAGLVTWNEGLVLETVCIDLEKEGYEVQPFVIPAVAVGAPHRRDRVWIVAHSTSEGREQHTKQQAEGQRAGLSRKSSKERPDWYKNWPQVATALCRVDDGLPRRLDRNPRLKALGNAIVPQVAEEIMKVIKEVETAPTTTDLPKE